MEAEGYHRGRSELGRWEKEGAGPSGERKKERERQAPPERVAGKREEKCAKKRDKERRNRWEGARKSESAWTERKRERRNASYSAQHPRWRWQRLPSSLKSIIKKYIRGHLRFSSVS